MWQPVDMYFGFFIKAISAMQNTPAFDHFIFRIVVALVAITRRIVLISFPLP